MDSFPALQELLAYGYLCDHCLGRQFAQLLSGHTNAERGQALRLAAAITYEIKPFPADAQNFSGFRFRKKKTAEKKKAGEKQECVLCYGMFDRLGILAGKVAAAVKNYEFSTFAIGTKVRGRLAEAEERLWEEAGTEWTEPLKAEINRELGKAVAALLKKEPDEKNPEMMITVTLDTEDIEIHPRSVYIAGGYKKLVRGISQSTWEKYPDSVEAQIARPFMAQTRAGGHAIHAAGREDVDARCLDWRPFVIELERPKKRHVNLRAGTTAITRAGKVQVKDLRIADKEDVIATKCMMPDKTYRVLAAFEKPLGQGAAQTLKKLGGTTILQQTPTRVLRRRADLVRKKRVITVRGRVVGTKKMELTITGQAGLYAKELVTGDNGRTTPSVAELLGNPASILELDVIKIHHQRR